MTYLFEDMSMECTKFILTGEDRKILSGIKNSLTSDGHIFLGYSKTPFSILRHVRSLAPDLVIVETGNYFNSLRQVVEVIDNEVLAACILVLDTRSDEIFEFLRNTKVVTYITKPVFHEVLLQIADISLSNYMRILNYEEKVRRLNESLESRKLVEKAKWILVEQENMSEEEAFDAIRKKSRGSRLPMREIAVAILLTRGMDKSI